MTEHDKFTYRSQEDFKQECLRLGVSLPWEDDYIPILSQSVALPGGIAPNRLGIHPMEGCDGDADGSPSELTLRRYGRFARGGAGVLWFEATAVLAEGRANPRQIWLHAGTADAFKRMFEDALSAARESCGHRPYTVLQLTHSGRYSRPEGSAPKPIIAAHNPYLDKGIPADYPVITDAHIEEIEDAFVDAAALAADAGFDAVDIKSCHRYLISELFSAFTREGPYGGSFENRTRMLRNIVQKIRGRLGGRIQTVLRMNVYDAIPYPYGWGVDRDDFEKPDLSEPIRLLGELAELGVGFANISAGNPYYNPHVGRPYDVGYYTPREHPLQGTERLLEIMKAVQAGCPDIKVMGTGLTWVHEYAAQIAAGCVREGYFEIAGFGRQAFAYPDFAADMLGHGGMKRAKCCIACSKCSVIMRDDGQTGCVPRDAKVYAPIFKRGREGKPPIDGSRIAQHV